MHALGGLRGPGKSAFAPPVRVLLLLLEVHLLSLDLMHVADYKGVTSSVWGSVLAALVSDAALGRSQQARLLRVNEFM